VKHLSPSKEELEWSKFVKVKTKQENEELRKYLQQIKHQKQGILENNLQSTESS
jgi:hypothetical protein